MHGARLQGLVERRETLRESRSQTILPNPADQRQVDQQVQSFRPTSIEQARVLDNKFFRDETLYQSRIEAATKSHR
ncbi:unannotated protein [freshwater metagenome]|uniref:Unannotated protein n=1 Tax=freshwater metagenome TaxID=449393 RepID=A0A6J6N300_9ZZZZ